MSFVAQDPSALFPPAATTLNCRGRLLSLEAPIVMGILNVTPDSFSDGGQFLRPEAAVAHAQKLVAEGATILDVGGVSTRPGATNVSAQEEQDRVLPALEAIAKALPNALLSIDTFRASVATAALLAGAHIVNDISGGRWDANMYHTAAQHKAPYILMHSRGHGLADLHADTHYTDPVQDLWSYFVERINAATAAGLHDLVLDLGLGFAKAPADNYRLLKALPLFARLGRPLLVGLSRKRLLTQPLGLPPEAVGGPMAALHFQALAAGVRILRVHDVAQAHQVVQLWQFWHEA